MNTRKESKWMTLLVLCTVLISFTAASYAQDEVSTKIVGFVKAPMGSGYYYYSVPFKQIGDDEQIIFLNADYDNDGTLDGFSEGTFSDQNFSEGDKIFKFDPTTGSFLASITFKSLSGKTGWFKSIPFPPFYQLSETAFTAGEGFVVQFANPPAEGGETYMLGEVNDQPLEIPISQGYNILGNPYPSNLFIGDAFQIDPDNDAISPTAGTGNTPLADPSGDVIWTGFNSATGSWQNKAMYWDKPTDNPDVGAKWYKSVPYPPFYVEIQSTDSAWILSPGTACMYSAKNGFIWKLESPVSE